MSERRKLAVVRDISSAGACHDATALPCCGHRFNVPDIGPPSSPSCTSDRCRHRLLQAAGHEADPCLGLPSAFQAP